MPERERERSGEERKDGMGWSGMGMGMGMGWDGMGWEWDERGGLCNLCSGVGWLGAGVGSVVTRAPVRWIDCMGDCTVRGKAPLFRTGGWERA